MGTPAAGNGLQPGLYAFKSYGLEEGLGNLSPFAMTQTSDGFLWVGTEDGLYRYDGHRFALWGKGLKSTNIWELAASPQGGLWVSTDDGIFDLQGADLVPVPGLPRQHAGLLGLGPGGSAIAAFGTQVFGRSGSEPMKVLKVLPAPITSGWASPDLHTLLATTENQIWRFENGSWSTFNLPAGFHGTGSRVFRDHAGHIYLRSRGNFWRLSAWGGAWTDLTAKLPGNAFNPYPAAEDTLGRIWVGTSKGLVCFDGDDATVLGEAKGLPGGWAGLVFIDREGSLWAGSEGLQKLKGRFQWTNFGIHQGLPAPNVWDIGRALDGRAFACTDSGVAVLKGETFSVLPGTEGRTLLAGGGNGKDSIWFGGNGKNEPYNVVFRMDLKSQRLEKISIKPCKTTDLILSIASAGSGIYVGTRFEGVFQVQREKSGWVTTPLPFPDRPGGDRVSALRKDPSGRLWAAGEHGLYVLENGRWTRLGKAEGLPGENCGSLARDPKGFIWVAFVDARGISRIAQVNGSWRVAETLTQPEALFKDAISSLDYEPKTGVLWLGTGGGMKRWDGKALQIFGRGDGLDSLDTSANGIAIDADGGVWQGFSSGLAHFDPRAYRGTPVPPAARLMEIRDARGEHQDNERSVRIPYQDRTLTFQFSALSFLNESDIVHEVRLVGLENDWRETRLNEARYTALPDGEYRFEVRSRFAEGLPGPVVGFSFRILPPWWGTWWFRSFCALGGAGLIGLYLWLRTAQLTRRNAHLEMMVAHRTEALEASKVELEKANRALEEASLVDPLTGLHNRRFLDLSLPSDALQAQRAFRELVDAGQDPLVPKEDIILFLMDIDHFKTVNDTHGHLAGDVVLKQLSTILRNTTRATDSLVRWGGEEFLLVARRTRRSGAAGIATNLLEAIRRHTFQLPDGVEFQKTWSIGFAALPICPRNPEVGDWQQALKMADQCLYAAKNTGRNRWVGALVAPDADTRPLVDLKSWDVGWAHSKGLMDVTCSEPDFRWPD